MSTPAPRRGFLEALFAICSLAIGGVVGFPVVSAFFDPTRKRTVRGGEGAVDAGTLDDLKVGVPKLVQVVKARIDAWDRSDAKPIGAIWLVRKDETKVDAFSAVCPHLGCQVGTFDEKTQTFECPCHVSAFGLDGACLKGPAPRGLDPLPVQVAAVEGGKPARLSVEWKRFLVGIASRREG